jgi:tetratricopeptide (TPR) repeat protein
MLRRLSRGCSRCSKEAQTEKNDVYSVLVALLVGAVTCAVWETVALQLEWAFGFGILLGLVAIIATFAILSRRTAKRIEPRFEQIQRQIQGGNSKLALSSLEEMLPLAKWQVLLKGQLYAQMGSLCFSIGDNAKALEYLEKASPRLSDGQLFLASLHYRKGEGEKAKQVIVSAIGHNKKQVILYNVYAWILNKEGDRDGAIAQLLRCLKVEKDNDSTKDNLQRLQNGKKMNMKRFGMTWYGLQFEKLPASMRQGQQQLTGRKGFRQKPRRR